LKPTANIVKSRQLWSNPKVLLNRTDLIIEGKYYPFARILGAYVEAAPAKKKPENQATPALKSP